MSPRVVPRTVPAAVSAMARHIGTRRMSVHAATGANTAPMAAPSNVKCAEILLALDLGVHTLVFMCARCIVAEQVGVVGHKRAV